MRRACLGRHGRGVVESLAGRWGSVPLLSKPKTGTDSGTRHIRIGTLSKALGSGGGFVCGTQSLIDWLANRARTYVFSTAQPPATSAAAIAALDIVEQEPHRREQLLASAAGFRARLREQGWNTGNSRKPDHSAHHRRRETHDAAGRVAARRRILCARHSAAVGAEGESLLRLSLCYHHTPEMIDALDAACQVTISGSHNARSIGT